MQPKYSVERTILWSAHGGETTWNDVPATSDSIRGLGGYLVLTKSSTIAGVRRVKHLKVQIGIACSLQTLPVFWAVQFVPEGYSPQIIHIPNMLVQGGKAFDLLSSNQFVMCAGCTSVNTSENVIIESPVARNLHSGDTICLTWTVPHENSEGFYCEIFGVAEYAVAFV